MNGVELGILSENMYVSYDFMKELNELYLVSRGYL